MKTTVMFLLGLLLCFACKQDDDVVLNCDPPPAIRCDSAIALIPVQDSCYEIPPSDNPFGYGIYPDKVQYLYPSVNPNDVNQFVVYKSSLVTPLESFTELVIIDRCTKEQQVLVDDNDFLLNVAAGNAPHWGSQDWIVFIGPRIIKSNGDSLSKITSGINYSFYNWCQESTSIITKRHYLDLQPSNRNAILTNDGVETDTLPHCFGWFSCRDQKILTIRWVEPDLIDIGYVDLSEEGYPFISIHTRSRIAATHPIDWLNDEQIVWVDGHGLHKMDIVTKEITLLKEACENVEYFSISTIPDGSGQILLHRLRKDVIGKDSLYTEQKVALFDTNTKEEWILDLDN